MSGTAFSLGGVVLAGGHSRRMGTDKAGLPHPLTREPMLLRQLSLLAKCTTEPPLISARLSQDLPATPPNTIRVNDDGASGPLGGIVSALERTACDHLIVIAVDLPNLSTTEITRLSQRLSTHDHGVYAQTPNGPQPLVSILPRSALPDLQNAQTTGELSPRKLFTGPLANSMQAVTFSDEEPFQNWNQPMTSED